MLIILRILLFVVLWLFVECTISLLATCDAPSPPYATKCTAFSGPLSSAIYFGFPRLVIFLKDYEHELIAGFTIVLAGSTILLWIATHRLWKVTRITAQRRRGADPGDFNEATAVA